VQGRETLYDPLLAVSDMHFDAKLLVDMLSQMLGTVNTSMLSTRTPEAEHQIGKASLYISCHMLIGQSVNMFEELYDFSIVFQETDDRLVKTR
jgi:hypothetical protein